MSWKPYRYRQDGDAFQVTTSWWVSVPDGRGCIDWDEETEDVDGARFDDEELARRDVAERNDRWAAAEAARKLAARGGGPEGGAT